MILSIFITKLLALSIVGLQIAIVVVLAVLIFGNKRSDFINFLHKNAIILALVVVLGATVSSLYYSEIVGFEPCNLCWYQRILLFPQLIILAIALKKKDESAVDYVLALSLIGLAVALYQYIGATFATSVLPCSAISDDVSCATKYINEFGYISMQMMSLTTFAGILTLAGLRKYLKY